MQFAARGLGARIAIGGPLFEPECAPAGVRAGDLLGPRRPGGPDASPTGLQLHSNLIFDPILKNGPNRDASSGIRLRNGAPKREAELRHLHSGWPSKIDPLKFDV